MSSVVMIASSLVSAGVRRTEPSGASAHVHWFGEENGDEEENGDVKDVKKKTGT
jgi:hypothetical protein